jgi:hypothetical protein
METRLRCDSRMVGEGSVLDRILYTKYIFECQGKLLDAPLFTMGPELAKDLARIAYYFDDDCGGAREILQD